MKVNAFDGISLETSGGTELEPFNYPNLSAIKQAFPGCRARVIVDTITAPDAILQFVWVGTDKRLRLRVDKLRFVWTDFKWASEASPEQRKKWLEW